MIIIKTFPYSVSNGVRIIWGSLATYLNHHSPPLGLRTRR